VPRNLSPQASAQDTIHMAYLHGSVTLTTNSCYFPTGHRQTVLCNGNAAYWFEWEIYLHVLFRTILLIMVFPIGQLGVFLKKTK
jgi:hypothetical protein